MTDKLEARHTVEQTDLEIKQRELMRYIRAKLKELRKEHQDAEFTVRIKKTSEGIKHEVFRAIVLENEKPADIARRAKAQTAGAHRIGKDEMLEVSIARFAEHKDLFPKEGCPTPFPSRSALAEEVYWFNKPGAWTIRVWDEKGAIVFEERTNSMQRYKVLADGRREQTNTYSRMNRATEERMYEPFGVEFIAADFEADLYTEFVDAIQQFIIEQFIQRRPKTIALKYKFADGKEGQVCLDDETDWSVFREPHTLWYEFTTGIWQQHGREFLNNLHENPITFNFELTFPPESEHEEDEPEENPDEITVETSRPIPDGFTLVEQFRDNPEDYKELYRLLFPKIKQLSQIPREQRGDGRLGVEKEVYTRITWREGEYIFSSIGSTLDRKKRKEIQEGLRKAGIWHLPRALEFELYTKE